MEKIREYYKEVLENVIEGNIHYSVCETSEGIHDCILLEANYDSANFENIEYKPVFYIFYKYDCIDGDYVSNKEHKILDSAYSLRNDGYGDGLYIDDKHDKELFDLIKTIVSKHVKIIK